MKIKAYDYNSGKDITLTAHLTTDHSQSSYGQPVMMIDEWGGQLMSAENWIIAGCYPVEMSSDEASAFHKWRDLILSILGVPNES